MTQVTTLERAVIRNIAVSQMTETLLKEISKGPESVKDNQVNAVILNLKKKSLVVQCSPNLVSLTDEGIQVHKREFPVAKTLDELRHESNLELSKVRPMSTQELVLTNQLIDIRKAAMKLGQQMDAFKLAISAECVTA